MSHPRIFVQIASYRDPECQWTVKDLFEKARFPENIFVGICWQYSPEHDDDCFIEPSPYPENTRILKFEAQESEGVCWARYQAQKLYQGEEYVLMIDSHMRFIDDWDVELIKELSLCASEKSFLSSYPPGYTPPNKLKENPRPTVLRAKQFNEYGDIRFDGEALPLDPEVPLRGAFLAAGFIFAKGNLVTDVPYDPYLYFNQEEICFAARAFTHGWDAYSATKTFIYHWYNTSSDKRRLHWEDNKDWSKMQTRSKQRYNYLLCHIKPENPDNLVELENYNLGTVRSLAEFEEFSGLDFTLKIASEKALTSGFIENLNQYKIAAAE